MDHETTPTSFWSAASEADYVTRVSSVPQPMHKNTWSIEPRAEKWPDTLVLNCQLNLCRVKFVPTFSDKTFLLQNSKPSSVQKENPSCSSAATRSPTPELCSSRYPSSSILRFASTTEKLLSSMALKSRLRKFGDRPWWIGLPLHVVTSQYIEDGLPMITR